MTKTKQSGGVGAQRKRVMLVDDHPLVRERLAEVVQQEPDLVVCGEAEDVPGALATARLTRPNLAIIDLTLKQSHGLDLIEALRKADPQILMLVVSMHDESLHAERAIYCGARGYITKQEATRKIIHAIRTVLAGKIYLSKSLAGLLATRLSNQNRAAGTLPIDTLTDREMAVFEMLGRGRRTRQIAEELGLNLSTVETYRARIKEKLSLKDGHELLQHAIRWVERPGTRPTDQDRV